jgi:hypothetical protein
MFIGFAYKELTTWTNELVLMSCTQFNGNKKCGITRSAAGSIEVLGENNAVVASSTEVIETGQWYYIEVKFTATDSTAIGDVYVKVNGSGWVDVPAGEDMDWYDQEQDYYGFPEVQLGCIAGYANCGQHLIDDLVVTTSGLPEPTGNLGSVNIVGIVPTGDGATGQFTNSSGTDVDKYLYVNNVLNSSLYVESSGNVDTIEMYKYSDPTQSLYEVIAVKQQNLVKSSEAGGSLRNIVDSQITGSWDIPSNEFIMYTHHFTKNPKTGSAFTQSEIENIEGGFKIV